MCKLWVYSHVVATRSARGQGVAGIMLKEMLTKCATLGECTQAASRFQNKHPSHYGFMTCGTQYSTAIQKPADLGEQLTRMKPNSGPHTWIQQTGDEIWGWRYPFLSEVLDGSQERPGVAPQEKAKWQKDSTKRKQSRRFLTTQSEGVISFRNDGDLRLAR